MSFISEVEEPLSSISRFIGSEQIIQFPLKKQKKQLYLEKGQNKKISDISQNNKKISDISRCYTCKPRGAVKKHIISSSACGQFIFHHDMSDRPLILVTPVFHVNTVYEFSELSLGLMFNAIKLFCTFWSIEDYQVSFNNGSWQTHHHFHIKIKIDEKIARRMRGDHFRRLKLEEQYPQIQQTQQTQDLFTTLNSDGSRKDPVIS